MKVRLYQHNRQGGFILADVMIAVVIIAIVFAGVGGVMSMNTQAFRGGILSDNRMIAYQLAQQRMEELNRAAINWVKVTTAVDGDSVVWPTYNKSNNPFPYSMVDKGSPKYVDPIKATETLPIKNKNIVFKRVTHAVPVKVNAADDISLEGNNALVKATVTVSWDETVNGTKQTKKVSVAALFER